jgi:hypothetical protein
MPFEPVRHFVSIGIGCAHFAAGRYESAARWVQDGVESSPESFWAERVLVAAAVHAGAAAEATRHARRLLRKDRSLTVASAREAGPSPPLSWIGWAMGLPRPHRGRRLKFSLADSDWFYVAGIWRPASLDWPGGLHRDHHRGKRRCSALP